MTFLYYLYEPLCYVESVRISLEGLFKRKKQKKLKGLLLIIDWIEEDLKINWKIKTLNTGILKLA